MDFDLTDDQRLLKDSVDRFVQDRYGVRGPARLPAAAGRLEPGGLVRARRAWPSRPALRRGRGRVGGTTVDVGLVMEAFGRALVIEPYFSSTVLCGALLRHGATAEERAGVLPGLIDGSRTIAFAQAERQARYSLNDVTVTAERADGTWHLSGSKSLVLNGDSADLLLVSARTAGTHRERHGISLFLVGADQQGVSRRGYPTQDGRRAAEIAFEQAEATLLGTEGEALPAIEWSEHEAIAALCAEAVGVMDAMHAMTVDYLKTRKQFGRAIGENPGPATPRRRHVCLPRTGPQHGALRLHDGRVRRRGGAPARNPRRQGADRAQRPPPRPGGHPAPRRHRRHHGIRGRATPSSA